MEKLEKTMAFKKLVFDCLKKAIISQEFHPGDILNERKIALELDVSRTPVREAIQMLEEEGWVKVFPWKGAVVQQITIEDVEEAFQLRIAIEPMVIDLILNRISEKELEHLQKIHEKQTDLAKSGDAENFILQDQEFHIFLAELTGNRRLCQIMQQLRDTHLRIGVEAMQQERRYEEILEEHGYLIECLQGKDALKARQAMLDHLLVTHRSMIRHMRNMEQKRRERNEN